MVPLPVQCIQSPAEALNSLLREYGSWLVGGHIDRYWPLESVYCHLQKSVSGIAAT